MVRQPALRKIIVTDWGALLGVAGAVGTVVIYACLLPTEGVKLSDAIGLTAFIGVVAFSFAIVALWRVRAINAVFRDGVEAPAVIEHLRGSGGRGWIAYRYTFRGREYQSGVPVILNDEIKALSPGDRVVVVVDQNNPKRALIRDLYS